LDEARFDDDREWKYGFFAAEAVSERKIIASKIANVRFITLSSFSVRQKALDTSVAS
jgi:hypothetical protein